MAPRVLLVANGQSIHTARFHDLLVEQGFDVRIFQVERGPFYTAQDLRGATVYVPSLPDHYLFGNRLLAVHPFVYELFPDPKTLQRKAVQWITARSADRDRIHDFRKVMRRYRPDVVISARMQPEGYFVASAKTAMARRFGVPWVHFVWGTDIEFFGKFVEYRDEHEPKIRQALRACDYLFSDTRRDAEQAPAFGFRGEHLGVFPAPGGFDLAATGAIRDSVSEPRDTILIKGREGSYVGRAFSILDALARQAPLVRPYRISVLLATPNVREILPDYAARHGLEVEVLEYLSYEDMLRVYARSRIAISSTTVDGMPSFLAEAMAMGALPIHSDMSSIREWIEDGENGLLFPVDDVGALERAIVRGLTDDALCERSARANWEIVARRLDRRAIGPAVAAAVRQAIAGGGRSPE